MADSEQKKDFVSFSVRFDPDLFDRLEAHLLGIKRQERPSKDKFIQEAVRERIAGSAGAPKSEESLKKTLRLLGQSVQQSDSDAPNRASGSTFGPVRTAVLDSTLEPTEIAWVEELIQLIASSVGAAEDFRRLLAIHQSKDGEVMRAISCNLAIFARIETVSRILRDERSGAAVPTAKEATFSERVQAVAEGSDETDRSAGEALSKIERGGEPDERSGRQSG